MTDCLFCKIFNKQIEAKIVFENENIIGFKDLYPMSKEHYLFIHKKHSKNVNEMVLNDLSSIGEIYQAIDLYTKNNQLFKAGFRVVSNVGKNGGQSVFHTHFHLLGGEQLGSFGK